MHHADTNRVTVCGAPTPTGRDQPEEPDPPWATGSAPRTPEWRGRL